MLSTFCIPTSRNYLKLHLRSLVINDTISVQILQIYTQAHTSTEMHICIHIYDIYSHIYKHMYNLHIFKFAPSGAKEMSTESQKEVRPDSLEDEELQGSLSTRGGALDLLIQLRPIPELSKVKVTNCLFFVKVKV